MRTTMVALSCVFAGTLGACEGAQVRRLLDKDAVPDTNDETDVVVEPALDFWLVGKGGELGRDEAQVTLSASDEVDDYLAFPGFQIDISYTTAEVANAQTVSLFVDGTLAAVNDVSVVDGAGAGTFRSVTIPDVGTPVVVRLETVDTAGGQLVAEKSVGFEANDCQLFVQFGLENGCLDIDAFGTTVFVTRESGACDAARATVDLGGVVVELGDQPFDEQGELFFAVPVPEGAPAQGVARVDVTALAGGVARGSGSAVGRFDAVAPGLVLVQPDGAVSVVDDADGDPANGLQYVVEVEVELDTGESATLRLSVGGADVAEMTVDASGVASFPAVELTQQGPTRFVVTATDGCGLTTTVEREVFVVTEPDQIFITSPLPNAVLLAAGDGDPATATLYESVFEVIAPSAAVGTTLTVECRVGVGDWTTVGTETLAEGELSPSQLYQVAVAVDVGDGSAKSCRARADLPNEAVSPEVALVFGIPPGTLGVTAPLDGACIGSAVVTFEGSAPDSVGLEVSLSGEGPSGAFGPVNLGGVAGEPAPGTWAGTFAPPVDGAWTFAVSTADHFGNPVASPLVNVVVDRLPPALSFVSPGVTLNGTAVPDVDPLPGYQTTVVVAVTEATTLVGGEVCLAVGGGAPSCVELSAQVTFTGVTLVPGANTLTLSGRDGCGNVAPNVTRTVTLTYDNNLAIVTPAAGTTLLARNDGNAATARIYETTFAVSAPEIAVGATLRIECRAPASGQTYTSVGSVNVAALAGDGRYNVPVAVDTAVLGTELECRASANLPAQNESASIAVTFGLPAPTALIGAPVSGACLTDEFLFSGTATGLDGRVLSARLVDGAGAVVVSADASVATGAFTALVGLGATADGAYFATVAGTDRYGNALADGAPPVVPVTVDRTAPGAVFLAPVGSFDETDDVDPVAPGIQAAVEVQVQDQNPNGSVCLVVNGANAGCQTASAGIATFASVTLQPGPNSLVAIANDACGNASNPVENQVVLLGESPVVVIEVPAVDLVTTATTLDVVVSVEDPETGAPLNGLAVTLYRDDVPVTVGSIDQGDGTYRFPAVPLTAGTSASYVAVAVDVAAIGASAPRVITQKNRLPVITVTTPANGAVLNLASTFCETAGTTCLGAVVATTVDAEDGSVAGLAVNCGSGAQQYSATVTGNQARFDGVALSHASTCTLVPSVTDLVEQTATGPTATVSVDRVAPNLSITTPVGSLLSSADQDPATDGIQAPLRANVGGVPANTTVTATLTWAGGTRVLTAVVAAAVAEGGAVSVLFEDAPGSGLVTWPVGVVQVTVTATDAANNPGSATRAISVVTGVAVRITGPASPVADTCTIGCGATQTCFGGTCWLEWGVNAARNLVVVTSGLETSTNNARICSDAPSLAGPDAVECDTAPSARGPFRQVALTSVNNGVNSLDLSAALSDTHHRLVVEVQPLTDGGWVSSVAATAATERERRVFVDLQAPAVVSITSPSDTLPPIGALNAAEQVAAPRVFSISYQVTEAGDAQLYVNGSVVDTRFVNAGTTTFNVTLPEGNPQIWVVVTDSVGNASPATPGLGATTYQPLVDVTPPTLTFSRPNTGTLRAGDNLDVVLASTAEGQTVTVFDAGTEVGAAVVTGGVATFPHASFGILGEGEHTLTASVSDAAGNPASAATSPTTIQVDTIPPVGTIISPAAVTQLLESDDASADPGFQVAVTFSTGNGAVSWTLSTARGCNLAFQNCQPYVVKASGAVGNPGGTEPVVNVTMDLDGAVTQHRLRLQTVDAVGNVHTTEVNLQVLFLTCALGFTDVPATRWFNASACAPGPSCAQAGVTVSVALAGFCTASVIRLYDGDTVIGTVNNPARNETFSLTVFDGTALSLEARAFNGATQIASTGVTAVGVDLVPPAVAFVATTLNGFTTPADGQDYTWTAADDVDPNTTGLQFHAAVRVSDANVEGGAITVLQSTGLGAPVALTPSNATLPVALAGLSPLTQSLFDLTLPGDAEQTVLVVARDAAGNTGSSSFTAVADGEPPAVVAISASTVDPRRPTVTLTWTAVGDDDMTGLPAGYEVRYSRFPITEANWSAACDATIVFGSDVVPAPATPGQSMTATFGAPDTRGFADPCKLSLVFADGSSANTPVLYLGVRAIDDTGNLSPLGAESLRTVTRGEIENRIKRVRFSNANNAFGATNLTLLGRRGSVLGDITNDGRADWAAYSANSQALCIFAGRENQPDDLVVDTLTSPTHACLIGSQVSSIFPGSTQTGHFVRPLGDVNGDGIGDFAVAGKITNGASNAASEAYMLVYFGRDQALPDLLNPNIKIRGIRALTGTTEYIGVCSPGDFDGVGASRTDDIAFGEPFASRVHVIPGRTTWNASTNITINLAPTFPTPGGTDLVDYGAWTVETTGIWGITGSAPSGSPPNLGLRCGSAGDVLPTPAGLGTGAKDDLFVAQSGSLDARIFIFPGREWVAGTVEQVSECVATGCVESPANVVTAEDQRSVRLRQDTDKLCQGFGGGLQGGTDLTGDGIPDLIATLPLRSTDQPTSASCSLPDGKSVFIFDGSKFAAAIGQDLRVGTNGAPLVEQAWTGLNGWILRASVNGQPLAARAIGDFDGWETGSPAHPTFDIAIGNRLGNAVAVRLNHVRPGLSISEGQFPVVDGDLRNPYSAADNSLGEWVDGGVDLTGDGQPDFLTGARTGEVLIIH